MPKLQKYIQKIRKYKEKFKKLVTRKGISYTLEIDVINEPKKELILPCHLGILFFGDFEPSFFNKIEITLDQIYDSFFFDIRNLGVYDFPIKLFYKGVKKEYREMKKSSTKINIHPTNKFYQILIKKRIEENLPMVLAVTDLPIFSSKNDNILFLFGEANLKHRCCIVSSLNLKEQFYKSPEDHVLLEDRILKEIIHEVGHLILGPNHCKNPSCVMKFSKSINEIDEKNKEFCENCMYKLDELRHEFNF